MLVYDLAVSVVRGLRDEVFEPVGRLDPKLLDQMRRAAQSVVLNCAEAQHARGKRSIDRFSLAFGEARETKAAVDLACALEYVEPSAELKDRCDHLCAILYKLSR